MLDQQNFSKTQCLIFPRQYEFQNRLPTNHTMLDVIAAYKNIHENSCMELFPATPKKLSIW